MVIRQDMVDSLISSITIEHCVLALKNIEKFTFYLL